MRDGLPTLTLHQPYASLIAERVKWIETRGWPAPEALIGQTIGIHAAARAPRRDDPVGDWLPYRAGDAGPWRMQHYATGVPGAPDEVTLPLGAIVATARLTACVPMVDLPSESADTLAILNDDDGDPTLHLVLYPDSPDGLRFHPLLRDVTDQLPYGDFAPGRWAWLLDDIAPTTERCPWCLGNEALPMGIEERCEARRYADLCPICEGMTGVDPVPAKGRQRVWYWTPDERTDR